MSQTSTVQRDELHRTIWRIANDLRGSVDGWDFKSYVLETLFYRFISENLTAYINEAERRVGVGGLRLRGPERREGRVRPARDGRREGLLHPAERTLRQCTASRGIRRESQRDAPAHFQEY